MPAPVPFSPASLSRNDSPTRTGTRPQADRDGDRQGTVADRTFGERVNGSARTTLALPGNPHSPALARVLVAEALGNCPRDTVETAVLLTSEIVTNAVRHADGNPLILTVISSPALVVTVEDTSPEPPAPAVAAVHDEHGRGLGLVRALASAWGLAPELPRQSRLV